MNIGLYFGSFNPIHVGHLIVAHTMASHTDLDEVWFVVSPQNPFKKQKDLLPEADRLHLVELAIEKNYLLRASNVEFNMPRPSYTVDTLTYLQEKHPLHKFTLIMGQDNLTHFHKWKNYKQILQYHRVFVYPRPGSQKDEHLLYQHEKIQIVEAPLLDISATYIRKCIAAGKSIQYLVPDAVAEQMAARKWYI